MQSFRVDKTELLDHLKRNKDAHMEEYQTAMIGWKEKVVKRLAEEQERLKDPNETPNLNFLRDLPRPASYEDDYTTALEALEWEHDDIVVLDWTQLNQWCRDKWGWTTSFTTTNAGYSQ